MKIIPLAVQQAGACYGIHRAGQFTPWSFAVFCDCLSTPYFAYQLVSDNGPCGYYIGLQVLDEITLMDIGVATELRGLGWGKSLLDDFLQQAEHRLASEVWLEVRESNAVAIQLYESRQFETIERRKNYYQTDSGWEAAIIMRKKLR